MRIARRTRTQVARATTRVISCEQSTRERLMRQMADDIQGILRDPHIAMTQVERLKLAGQRRMFLQNLPGRAG